MKMERNGSKGNELRSEGGDKFINIYLYLFKRKKEMKEKV